MGGKHWNIPAGAAAILKQSRHMTIKPSPKQTEGGMAHKAHGCSRCGKAFHQPHSAKNHIKDVHGGVGEVVKRKRPPVEPDDESIADRMVQAEIDRACGIENPDIEWLLP